jgi:hypothetical protein
LSNTPNLQSSLGMRDQVSHPYKTTGKIIILYILIFKFFVRRQQILNWMVARILLI